MNAVFMGVKSILSSEAGVLGVCEPHVLLLWSHESR